MKDFSKAKRSKARLKKNEQILGHSTSKEKIKKDMEEMQELIDSVDKELKKKKRKKEKK